MREGEQQAPSALDLGHAAQQAGRFHQPVTSQISATTSASVSVEDLEGDLPNLPDDGREYCVGDALRARAHVDEEADWYCHGCGLRIHATKIRVCPRCGNTTFQYDPVDGGDDE